MRKALSHWNIDARLGGLGCRAALALSLLLCVTEAWALAEGGSSGAPRIRPAHFAQDACRVIGEEASKRGLPASFFARLIWKESLFNPYAVSPVGAQGIAQFMPGTASERGLVDPFDPAPALAASAHFLSDLKAQFGNWGLAAAAYNAGPGRVANWVGGARGLPLETQHYVHWITGHSAESWVEKKDKLKPIALSDKLSFMAACQKLAAKSLQAKLPDAPFQQIALKKPDVPLQQAAKKSAAKKGGEEAAAEPKPDMPLQQAPKKSAAKKSGEKAAAKPKPAQKPKAARSPWGVQVAAHFSEKIALAQFARAKKGFPAILGGLSATTVASKNRSRGNSALHSVRVGAPSKSAAETLCSKLKSAGGSCLVLRN